MISMRGGRGKINDAIGWLIKSELVCRSLSYSGNPNFVQILKSDNKY